MENDFYSESMSYEAFIRRAHKCMPQSRLGAHNTFMQNLMRAEIGSNTVSHLPSAEKQREKVVIYMRKAIDKFLKKKTTADEKEKLNDFKIRLDHATSSFALMQIVTEGLEITSRFKDL